MNSKKMVIRFSYEDIDPAKKIRIYSADVLNEVEFYEPFHLDARSHISGSVEKAILTPVNVLLVLFGKRDEVKVSQGSKLLLTEENDAYTAKLDSDSSFSRDVTDIITPILKDLGCSHLEHPFVLLLI